MKLLMLLFSSAAAANVILSPGISTRDDMFMLVCSSKGNVLVWRINGSEIAIFNGREGGTPLSIPTTLLQSNTMLHC